MWIHVLHHDKTVVFICVLRVQSLGALKATLDIRIISQLQSVDLSRVLQAISATNNSAIEVGSVVMHSW
jgi:phage FluMu protein gp41